VCVSLRARENPFTQPSPSFRDVTRTVCGLRARTCVQALDGVFIYTRLPSFTRSLARLFVRSSRRRRCAREPRHRSALLFYSRILFFVRADARFAFVSLRPSVYLILSLSRKKRGRGREKKRERVRENDSNVPSARQDSSPCRLNPSFLPVLVRREHTPDVNAPRTFAHLFALIAPDCKETRRRA